MYAAGSVVLLVVLATICADLFPLSSAFQWVKDPGAEIKVTYPSQKTLVLKWEWRLSGSERVNQVKITRYKTKDKDNTGRDIGHMYADGKLHTDNASFSLSGQTGTVGGSNGYMELKTNDINNQGYNKDNSTVDVIVSNYTYECDVIIIGSDYTSISTKLIVYVKPTITTAPENKYVDTTKTNVVLKCKADGKPKPNIVWEIRRPSGTISSISGGEELTISKATGDDFQKTTDVGIYTCTATNNVGSVRASAVVQFIQCYSGCSTDDKIAIEMTELTYISDYDNPSSVKYIELKNAIEKDSFYQYIRSYRKNVYSCVVTSFRKGIHGVVANIKITYPTSTNEPRKPLQTAIETGTFAGQRVKTSFISPRDTVLQLHPNQLEFCYRNNTINITCKALIDNPAPTNLTFFFDSSVMQVVAWEQSVNYTEAVVTRDLNQTGTFSLSCQSNNRFGSFQSSRVIIAVKDPLAITNCTNKIAMENTNLVWTCDVSGSQPLNISWFKGNTNTVIQSGKSLNITTVSKADAGMYRFTASNGEGCPTASTTVHLNVLYKPEQLTVNKSQNGFIDINEGQSVNITCTAKGNPDPHYYWVFDGKQLSNSSSGIITISNVTENKTGMYTCTAVNLVGNESIAVMLRVPFIGEATCDAKPDPVKEYENLTLNCSAAGYPPVNYTWTLPTKVINQPIVIEKATTRLNGVNMPCKAMNSRGSRTCTKTITVHYKPRKVQVVPANPPALNINGSFNLTCNASSSPDGSYTWSLNGVPLVGKTNRVLTKDNTTLQDAGEYTCTVTNSEGSGISNKVVINVNYAPNIQCDPVRYVSENNSHVFKCKNAKGFPTPYYKIRFNGKMSYEKSVTIKRVTKALNGSYIWCFASNRIGSDSCNTKLIVGYKPTCTANSFEVTDGQCVYIENNGDPLPSTLNCFPPENVMVAKNGKIFTICGAKGNTISSCTLNNLFGHCNIIFKVHQRVTEFLYKGWFKITNRLFQWSLRNKTSVEFKTLKATIESALKSAYSSHKYINLAEVLEFWEGSVIVVFQLWMTAKINHPLSPIMEALRKNGGYLNGLKIDPNNIKSGEYRHIIHDPFHPRPTITPCAVTDCSQESAIVLGVLFAISLVLNLILVGYIVWRLWIKNRTIPKTSSNMDVWMDDSFMLEDHPSHNVVESASSQEQQQQQPTTQLEQPAQTHSATSSSVSPNTETAPPKPAVIANGGAQKDLQGTSHQSLALDNLGLSDSSKG